MTLEHAAANTWKHVNKGTEHEEKIDEESSESAAFESADSASEVSGPSDVESCENLDDESNPDDETSCNTEKYNEIESDSDQERQITKRFRLY